MKKASTKTRAAAWLLTLLLTAGLLALVIIPVFVVHPFKAQTPRGLAAAYAMRNWSPLVTLIGSGMVLALVIWMWRNARWWSKALLVVFWLLTLPAVWFARQNHFEWMFNLLTDAAYAKASEVDFVEDTDMVLAVELNGEAAAYPVRQMAYHHIAQDVVGGVPIVATY